MDGESLVARLLRWFRREPEEPAISAVIDPPEGWFDGGDYFTQADANRAFFDNFHKPGGTGHE